MASDEIDVDVGWFKATRAPEHDARASLFLAATVETHPVYLRNAGWLYEGESPCDTCGLYANGMDRFAVCRECHLCKECGCEEDCQQSEGWSCT